MLKWICYGGKPSPKCFVGANFYDALFFAFVSVFKSCIVVNRSKLPINCDQYLIVNKWIKMLKPCAVELHFEMTTHYVIKL